MRNTLARVVFAFLSYVAIMAWGAWLEEAFGGDVRAWALLVFVALTALSCALSGVAGAFLLRTVTLGNRPFVTALIAVGAGATFYLVATWAADIDLGRIDGFGNTEAISVVAMSSLTMPLVEEFFFRRVMIGESKGLEAVLPIVLSATGFALLHPDRAISTFVFSLVAAAFYMRGGLGAAWGFHAAYNLSNYAVLLFFSARNG